MRPEALDALRMDRESVLARHFPLLEAAGEGESAAGGDAGGDVATLDSDTDSGL